MNKPPIGIMPKYIWDELRKQYLQDAMIRYIKAEYPIPYEWVEEYIKLIDKRRQEK